MSSDETHEQIIEHRSVFAVDDALVVTTISKTDTPVCGTCWRYVQHDDEHETTEYIRAPWPCENARLRERVAELEAAGTHALDSLADIACVHGRGFDSNEYADWDSYCSVCAAMRPLAAALSQADETGGAR